MTATDRKDLRTDPAFPERMNRYLTDGLGNRELLQALKRDFPGYDNTPSTVNHISSLLASAVTWRALEDALGPDEAQRLLTLRRSRTPSHNRPFAGASTIAQATGREDYDRGCGPLRFRMA